MYRRAELSMFRTEDLGRLDAVIQKTREGTTSLGELYYVSTGAEIHGKESYTADGTLISGHSKFDLLSNTPQMGWKQYIEGSAIPKSKEWGRYCYVKTDGYLNYDNSVSIMRSPKFRELFDSEKIMIRGSSGLLYILATLDDRNIYTSHKNILIIDKAALPNDHSDYKAHTNVTLRSLLAILNSQLIDFYYRSVFGGFIDVYPNYLKALPIRPVTAEMEKQLSDGVNKILSVHREYEILKQNVLAVLQTDLRIPKLTEKLQNWPALDWPALLDELKKQKVGVSLTKQMDWRSFYADQRAKALDLQTQRAATDRQIDKLVYVLYELTETEIALVEGS